MSNFYRPPFRVFSLIKGFLVATDGYMNLQLASTEEYIDGNCTGNLGEVLVRFVNKNMLTSA